MPLNPFVFTMPLICTLSIRVPLGPKQNALWRPARHFHVFQLLTTFATLCISITTTNSRKASGTAKISRRGTPALSLHCNASEAGNKPCQENRRRKPQNWIFADFEFLGYFPIVLMVFLLRAEGPKPISSKSFGLQTLYGFVT